MSLFLELLGYAVDMIGPLDQHQPTPAVDRGLHIDHNLLDSSFVGDERSIDGRHPAGCRRLCVTGVPEVRGVQP